jgi:hypothetical protein
MISKRSQQGLGWFGMLIVIAIAVAVAYYAYRGVSGADEPPSCGSGFNACMKSCRRTSTEAPAAQACQDACRRDQAACDGERR